MANPNLVLEIIGVNAAWLNEPRTKTLKVEILLIRRLKGIEIKAINITVSPI